MKNFKITVLIGSMLLTCLCTGCGIYSFTGASIGADIKTISIQTFYNNAPLGPSNMSVTFTEKIKDYYQQNTSLELVDNNGDLQIDGFISNYTVTPVAANQGAQNEVDFSALTRITITVSATYVNLKDPTFDFDKNFSFFKDFESDIDIAANEELFSEEIFDQIILDIFNASVANW
ncbi:MAG: LptE family protein [Bacteroidota bacterium]